MIFHYTRNFAVCIAREGKNLKQFDIVLRSFKEVQEFVELATVQPFRIVVGNDRTRVNAKSFMGMPIKSLDSMQLRMPSITPMIVFIIT